MPKYTPSADCYNAANNASEGKLSKDEIEAAFQRIADYRDRLRATGDIAGMEDKLRSYAEREAERTKIAAAMQRRHAALNILVRDRLDQTIETFSKAGLKPDEAIRALMEGSQRGVAGARNSVAALKLAYSSKYAGAMFAQIEKERPHIKGMLADKQFDADLTREMIELGEGGKPGSTGNADAQYTAKVFSTYAEMARTDLNRLGASIGKLDGWAGPQTHDDLKMISAGKEKWIDGVLPRLNLERTFPDIGNMADVRGILREVYDQIITDVPNKPTARELGERVNPANLAKSLGKSRVLHFKDADSAIAYRAEFGYGTAIHGMMSQMERMAGMAAQMERFGPNPELMFGSIIESQRRKVRDSNMPDAEKVAMADKLKNSGEAGSLRHAFDVMSGMATRPVNVNAAKIAADVRAAQAMAKLGGAVISSIPSDTVTAALASQFRGSGFFKGLTTQIAGVMAGRSKGEQAEIAHLLGEGFDAVSSHVASAAAAHDGPIGRLSKIQSTYFKWNGLQWWTDVSREVAAKTISREMGLRAQTAFNDLPGAYRHVLEMNGISEAKWEVLRQANFRTVDGRAYVTPDRIEALPDSAVEHLAAGNVARERSSLADRIVKRSIANDREQQWVSGRKTKLDDWLKEAEARQDSKLGGNQVRTEIEQELARRKIEVEKARIEQAKVEMDLLGAVRGIADQDSIRGLLDAVENGQDASKIAERTDAIVERLAGQRQAGGETLGVRRQRAVARVRDLEKQIVDFEKGANARDQKSIDTLNAQFQGRYQEIKEFSDRVFTREQERIDLNTADTAAFPERSRQLVDDARREIAMDIRRFVADETNYGVIETDARSRRTTTMGTRPGTLAGEAIRFVMQFKGFPIAFTQRVLGRAIYGQRGANKWEKLANGAPHMGAMIAGLGIAGYMSVVMKDLIKGYWPPRDPTDPKTWIASLQQGGGLGIYGDFLFGQANRFGSGALETFSGPTIGAVSDLINIPLKARDAALKGTVPQPGADILNFVTGNTPFANLAYVKPALDYLILNSMREAVSPGYLRRQSTNRLKQYGQRSVIPPRAF